jgi:hypothetical protein
MANQDDYIKTALRLPRDIHAKLLGAADATGKSMNAEIIARLESSFSGGAESASLLATIARLNLDIAMGELDKQAHEVDAANLALSLKEACELLLSYLKESDDAKHKMVKSFMSQAEPHLQRIDSLTVDLEDRLANMKNAVQALSAARANLITESDKSPSRAADTQPAAEAAIPKQRPKHIVRKVTK